MGHFDLLGVLVNFCEPAPLSAETLMSRGLVPERLNGFDDELLMMQDDAIEVDDAASAASRQSTFWCPTDEEMLVIDEEDIDPAAEAMIDIDPAAEAMIARESTTMAADVSATPPATSTSTRGSSAAPLAPTVMRRPAAAPVAPGASATPPAIETMALPVAPTAATSSASERDTVDNKVLGKTIPDHLREPTEITPILKTPHRSPCQNKKGAH